MKKLFAILLAVSLLASVATIVSAANTTTLTTTVPAASYTLNIPANQEIPFGATETEIGGVSVTNSVGFAEGKNLKVTITYTDFTCADVNTTIPINLYISWMGTPTSGINAGELIASGGYITFEGKADGTVTQYKETGTQDWKYTWIAADSKDWGKALAGDYTATITFTAEVVTE